MRSNKIQAMLQKMRPWLVLSVCSLSGCAVLGNTNQCRVMDPDLVYGQYTGGCQDGLAEGYGEVHGNNTDYLYRGSFHAGKKQGRGIKIMSNGDRYEGEFDNDYRHGTGKYIWGPKTQWAGQWYSGQYRHDLRHGWGVFQWETGDRYEGEWKDDIRVYASAREVRKLQAEAAQARQVGVEVCNTKPFNAETYPAMRGKIEAQGLQLQIRLTSVEGGSAEYYGHTLKVGDLLADDTAHWPLCGKK